MTNGSDSVVRIGVYWRADPSGRGSDADDFGADFWRFLIRGSLADLQLAEGAPRGALDQPLRVLHDAAVHILQIP